MNQFGLGAGGGGGGFNFGTPKTAGGSGTSAAPAGFSFSSAISAGAGSGGSFGFGSPAPNAGGAPPAAGLFSFATPAASTQASAFSFGMPPASAAAAAASPAAGVFTLGGNAPKLSLGGSGATTAPAATGGFGLGSSSGLAGSGANSSVPGTQAAAAATPAGFVFGSATTTPQPAPAAAAAAGGFSFGGAAQTGAPNFSLGSLGSAPAQMAPTGPNFGVAPASTNAAVSTAAASQAAPAFSLGTASTGSGFGVLAPAAVTSTTTTTALSFGAKPGGTTATSGAPATIGSSLLGLSGPTLFASVAGSSAPATCTAISLSVGTSSTGAAPVGTLGFGSKMPGVTTTATAALPTAGAVSVPAAGFLLNLKPLATTSVAASTSTATTTTGMTSPVMTYAQLESLINKWSLELEDQEKHFLQQATQVNAWDRTLIENGEKITTLHREVEKVKLDQKRLDQELDFILSQQKELEDLLIPLEESVKEQSGTIYLQHADEEREKTYKLAENIDAQLKRMAQDLKDIIEHLNTSGGPADNSDPLQQICKILNAHMDSLQWIDQNSALLQRKVEEMSKVCESRRKEQERSFRITFD
ncbi:nucleoporin-62 C-terminal-like protein [Protobothrops mucrosquamatus]|uniref:nucleoporin-62 C-terminal-like protein n=1 Tax=Protobothrops mucrosquamatus TaxID=103944 RepID=UPI000775B4A5|nr:nucleoporin-62 C-terminal-like protein [Protobothrops mucrosquamatus]